MTADISRHSLRPLQNYTGVVRQQGRLPLDAEETEAGDIGSLLLRDAIAETICEKGAPGDGFLVSEVGLTATNLLDFSMADGVFYLGGLRCSTAIIPGSGATGMTYQDQPDWIGMDVDSAGPGLPNAGDTRTDLVYLEANEQTVTATEDSELFEVALGGADSSARRRIMSRVKVLEGTDDSCHEAFADLITREYPGGVLDDAGCEVKSQTSLTIGFTTLDPLNDLCRPAAQAGFLGARNETFRVQVTTPGRFVWSRDNGAPLYRVQVQAHPTDSTRRKLVFLTPPRDEFGWPLAGMTVEVLRWGALLDNREKAAESQGLLLSVENGFDPSDDSILVSAEVPQDWDDWFASADGLASLNPLDDALAGLETYFYLRVWTGGGDAGGAVDHAIDAINPVDIGETGLTALFSSDGMPGDYWIVSARPNTPTRVTPHGLLTGTPPVGPRRLVAPLALIPWTGPVPGEAIDCRHRFRPLCRVGGCCRVTVGDGLVSHGDVSSIQEAINRLPAEGGEVCIHEGDYVENVIVESKQNITITGCGRGTRWVSNTAQATLSLSDCEGIHVRRLTMTAGSHQAVLSKTSSTGRSADLVLEDLLVTASDASAIAIIDIEAATLRRCQIYLQPMSIPLSQDPDAGRTSAIFLDGTELVVEDCRIDASQVADRLFLAVGGIHIAAGSEQVIIRDNVISGGNGHGITLGSVQFVAETGELTPEMIKTLTNNAGGEVAGYYGNSTMSSVGNYSIGIYIDAAGCIRLPGTPGEIDIPEDTPVFPESGGVVRDVRILRNDITGMGFNGISAHVFSGLGQDGLSDMVAIESIEISDNRITGCMINEIGPSTALLRQFIGWGGIALSLCSDATIRDNLIANNGAGSTEPICGVFLAIAEDVRVERNRIEGNGIDPDSSSALAPGRRGGIVIGFAMGGVSTYGDNSDQQRSVDRPALMVCGNTVDAPGARALKAITMGPVMVLGNRLTGAGRSALASNVFGSLIVGGLALSHLSDQIFDPAQDIDLLDYVYLELLSEVLGGDAVNLISLCVAEELAFVTSLGTGYQPERLRGGEMLVNDNQISLQPHSPALPFTLSSVMLMSADDVSFCDNQSEIENNMVLALTDVLVVATSLRVSSNRLQKRLTGGILSAITFGLLNQTASNQSTHCILAIGPSSGRLVTGNRDFFGLAGIGFCEFFEEFASSLSETLNLRLDLDPTKGEQQ
jgi:hypothetical protein